MSIVFPCWQFGSAKRSLQHGVIGSIFATKLSLYLQAHLLHDTPKHSFQRVGYVRMYYVQSVNMTIFTKPDLSWVWCQTRCNFQSHLFTRDPRWMNKPSKGHSVDHVIDLIPHVVKASFQGQTRWMKFKRVKYVIACLSCWDRVQDPWDIYCRLHCTWCGLEGQRWAWVGLLILGQGTSIPRPINCLTFSQPGQKVSSWKTRMGLRLPRWSPQLAFVDRFKIT